MISGFGVETLPGLILQWTNIYMYVWRGLFQLLKISTIRFKIILEFLYKNMRKKFYSPSVSVDYIESLTSKFNKISHLNFSYK